YCSVSPRPPGSRSWGCGRERLRARTGKQTRPSSARPGCRFEGDGMSVTAPKGFVAGGAACGIKEGGAPDLAIVATEDRTAVPAAGVFTTNLACAAPVQISRRPLTNGHAAAVVLSSGNANAATGERGRTDARRMTQLTGE